MSRQRLMTIKYVTEEEAKKKLKSLIGFLSAKKNQQQQQRGGKKKKKKIQKNLHNKSKNNNNKCFSSATAVRVLSHAGTHSPPYLPRMPSNTVLTSGPAVGAGSNLVLFLCVLASNVHSYHS